MFHEYTINACHVKVAHVTLLQMKGTAAGARSPSLCKVAMSPFIAAVRRPVCTCMPQSNRKTDADRRISTPTLSGMYLLIKLKII